jgi:putative ABC transport system ATP-binding protein
VIAPATSLPPTRRAGAADPASFVTVHALEKQFPFGTQWVTALGGVDLEVARGEMLVVMGPSGSGKSTLLNLIGGLDRPTGGWIRVAGQEVSALDEIGLAVYRRTMVGFVFQSFNLIPTMTARANVAFPMMFAGRKAAERAGRAEQLLTAVGLGHRIDHRPIELSGGEQQRVAIARALANDPELLLGDEPTGNLDTKTGQEVMDILGHLPAEGKTVIVVTHDARLEAYADRVVRMEDGRIVDIGPGRRRGAP